jgi:hypothetical protein
MIYDICYEIKFDILDLYIVLEYNINHIFEGHLIV